jgi:hypothetical protein
MNHTNFMTWVRAKLLPNLPPQAVLVTDNASYHNIKINKDPTSTTKKNDMISWLVPRNITHDPRKTKPELYELIKQNKPRHCGYVLGTELESISPGAKSYSREQVIVNSTAKNCNGRSNRDTNCSRFEIVVCYTFVV